MIEINNLTFFDIDKKNFSTVAKNVLKGENRTKGKISLAFVAKKEIKKINKKFRWKNKPTDVLAFAEDSRIKITNSKSNYLGEIIICPEMAEGDIGMTKAFVHGILHLLGYDHKKSRAEAEKMRAKEEYYLRQF